MSEDAVRSFVEAHPRGTRVRGTVKEKTDNLVHVTLDDNVSGVLKREELDSDPSSIDMIYGYISEGDPISAFVLGSEAEFVRLTKIERPSLFLGDVIEIEIIEAEGEGFTVKMPSGSFASLPNAELAWTQTEIGKKKDSLSPGTTLDAIVIALGTTPVVSVRSLIRNPTPTNLVDFVEPDFEFSILNAEYHWRNQLFMELRRYGIDAPRSSSDELPAERLILHWKEDKESHFHALRSDQVPDEVGVLFRRFPSGFSVRSYEGPEVDELAFWDAVLLLFWVSGEDSNKFYKRRMPNWEAQHDGAPPIGDFHRLANLRNFETLDLTPESLARNFEPPIMHIREFSS